MDDDCVLSNDDPHGREFSWCGIDPGTSEPICGECPFRYQVKVQVSPGVFAMTDEFRCSDVVHHRVSLQLHVPGAVLRCSSRPGLRVHNYGACGIDCDECWNKAMKACVEKANAH
jgi:hypothetical protein